MKTTLIPFLMFVARKMGAPALLLMVTACSASMVQRPGLTVPYGPLSQKSKSEIGVVKYLNTGMDVLLKKRRDDAYKQMFMACNGRYEIVSEDEKLGGVVVSEYAATPMMWRYISFVCVDSDEKAELRKLDTQAMLNARLPQL